MTSIRSSRYFGPDMMRRALQSALAATATYLLTRTLNVQGAFPGKRRRLLICFQLDGLKFPGRRSSILACG